MELDEENIEMTTLSVPKQFRQKLVKNYNGSNDLERLQKWGEDYSETVAYEKAQQYIMTEDFEKTVSGIIRNQLITYNTELRDSLEEVIEGVVRDMNGGRR